jgi:fumarate hydratase class II
MATRIEHDTFGPIAVPAERLWGAQTQRSLQNFDISGSASPGRSSRRWPGSSDRSAVVNHLLGLLDQQKAAAIVAAADEVLQGRHDVRVPAGGLADRLGHPDQHERQRGAGQPRQRAAGGSRGEGRKVHPNDDVNKSQSSNDVYPTAMHLAAVDGLRNKLLPALAALKGTLAGKSREFQGIVKIGRTHLQDATPLTLGRSSRATSRSSNRPTATCTPRCRTCANSRWAAPRWAPASTRPRATPRRWPRNWRA